MGAAATTRTRRHRRRAKLKIRSGGKGVRKHKRVSGRTGSIHAKRIGSRHA